MRAPRAAIQCAVWALLASCAAAFIVPEELVSFLSIVYSNIPPIRKGTDSRVGLGFRLGPHADAQIVLELGPQTNTRPLQAGGPNFGSASSSKRHAALQPLDNDALDNGVAAVPVNAAAGNWLTAWRTSVAAKAARRPVIDNDLAQQADVSGPASGPVTAPDPTKLSGAPLVSHLRKLYRKEASPPSRLQLQGLQDPARPAKPSKRAKATAKTKTSTTTRRPTAAPDDLSDVALD